MVKTVVKIRTAETIDKCDFFTSPILCTLKNGQMPAIFLFVFCFAGRKMEIQLEEVENQYASLGECF
jgi:hypothetical protein